MSIQPSASKANVFVNCSWPFDPARELEGDAGSTAARYGSAFHDVIAAVIVLALKSGVKPVAYDKLVADAAERWNVRSAGHELAGHVWGSFLYLRSWLMGKNPWGVDFSKGVPKVESSYAFQLLKKNVEIREVANPSVEGHHYELQPGEMGGTVDLELVSDIYGLTLDHKTGASKDFSSPSEDDQLKSLGLAQPGEAAVIVAVGHFDRRGLPMIYAEEATSKTLREHGRRLQKAMRRVGDGSMTPGPWCKTCPARSICPTQFSQLIPAAEAIAGQVLEAGLVKAPRAALTTPEGVGRAHLFKNELTRLLKKLDEEIHAWVDEHPDEVAVRPDGKSLEYVEKPYRSISLGSITDALGKIEGEKLIAKLEKQGIIKKTMRRELHAVAERG